MNDTVIFIFTVWCSCQ